MSKSSVIKRAWIATVLSYAVVRTVLIWKIFQKYGVNQYLYLAIDLISAYFYAIYSTKLVVEASKTHYKKLIKYLALTLIFNFIPDLYVLTTASEVPKFIIRSFIEIILIFAGITLFTLYKEIEKRRK